MQVIWPDSFAWQRTLFLNTHLSSSRSAQEMDVFWKAGTVTLHRYKMMKWIHLWVIFSRFPSRRQLYFRNNINFPISCNNINFRKLLVHIGRKVTVSGGVAFWKTNDKYLELSSQTPKTSEFFQGCVLFEIRPMFRHPGCHACGGMRSSGTLEL